MHSWQIASAVETNRAWGKWVQQLHRSTAPNLGTCWVFSSNHCFPCCVCSQPITEQPHCASLSQPPWSTRWVLGKLSWKVVFIYIIWEKSCYITQNEDFSLTNLSLLWYCLTLSSEAALIRAWYSSTDTLSL